MRLGIRLQLLLALGSLLVLAFVPLFFAVASLTRASMISVRESSARALGRAIAGHVAAAREGRPDAELAPLLDAQVGQEGVAAIGVYGSDGRVVAQAGDAGSFGLPSFAQPDSEQQSVVQTNRGAAILVVVPSSTGAVAVVVRTDSSTVPTTALVRLFALYTGVVGLALLLFAYSAMTRLVVRPVEGLSAAARKVADGGRRMDVPRTGAHELVELGSNLARMTEKLRADEEELRQRVVEIEKYAADLKRAQERLVRSERLASVGRLSAGLAHEIGNPIAAILGFQELLIAGGLEPAEQRDFLERMKRETERIHRILRDLLDFARPAVKEAEGGPPGEPGDVNLAVRDVLALVQPQKGFRGIEIATDLAPDLPRVVLEHPRIVQVLLNLLLNSADAIPKTGGRIVVRAARRSGTTVRIEVEDNGPGIAESVREQLFEPFVTTKEVGKGTGLGLAVCRGLAEAAGGSIGLEQGSYGGARFVMDLPAEVVDGVMQGAEGP